MTNQELCFLTLSEQAGLIRNRQVSPVEVVASVLGQIERVDGEINSFITVMAEAAFSAAREAEKEITRGRYRGRLHGIPIALKDVLGTKGVRTTAGSRLLRDFVPDHDATVVSRLREAGAVILGKTGLYEFAYSVMTSNPLYGEARNPWDPARMTGGSSSGSAAAVAAFECSTALGSDTGGSIRLPAALCGVVGLKPTYGRVSRYGVIPTAWSLDTLGPMSRTVEDAALVLAAIAGWDPRDPTSSPEPVPDYAEQLTRGVSGLKVAVLREYLSDPIESAVVTGFHEAVEVLRQQGIGVEELSVPELRHAPATFTAISAGEAATYHERWLRTRPEEYGEEIRRRLELGLLLAASEYLKAQRVRALLAARFRAVLGRYDALLSPTVPITAPGSGRETIELEGRSESTRALLPRNTRVFNLPGLPALTVPCGFASNGLPMGFQIAAAPFAEGIALRIAHAYQQSTA